MERSPSKPVSPFFWPQVTQVAALLVVFTNIEARWPA
jgi:hypothetical protein